MASWAFGHAEAAKSCRPYPYCEYLTMYNLLKQLLQPFARLMTYGATHATAQTSTTR